MIRTVLFADVVGYSALMERLEEETQTLTAYAIGVLSNRCKEFGGTVRQIQGDGVMVEFADAASAIGFAVAFQRRMESEPLELSRGERIVFRIGIHTGPVIKTAAGTRGNTVNVAARVQDQALPGGVCVTAQTLESMRERGLDEYPLEDLGFKNLKNIFQPYRLYLVPTVRAGRGGASDSVGGASLGRAQRDPHQPPSLILCPFRIAGDVEPTRPLVEAAFDELVYQLSRRPEIRVHSSSLFASDEKRSELLLRLCRFFGIDYMIEGAALPSHDTVAIRVRLVRAADARIVHASDFAVRRDDVSRDLLNGCLKVALRLMCNIVSFERAEMPSDPKDRGQYQRFILAQRLAHTLDETSNQRAIRILQGLLSDKGDWTNALVELAHAQHMAWRYDWGERPGSQLEAAVESARRATTVDPDSASAFSELGFAQIFAEDLDGATTSLENAFQNNPHDPWVLANMSDARVHAGDALAGLDLMKRSLAMNNTLHGDWRIWSLADVYFFLGDYENVVRSVGQMRDWTQGSRLAAASLGLLGRPSEARRFVNRILEVQPGFSIDAWARKHPVSSHERFIAPFVKGLSTTGLPR